MSWGVEDPTPSWNKVLNPWEFSLSEDERTAEMYDTGDQRKIEIGLWNNASSQFERPPRH
jgi:hypothetical protein